MITPLEFSQAKGNPMINFDFLVAGCNTRCQHCYVNGGPGPMMPLADALAAYRDTVDSGFYPGGAYYETEEASLRGTCLITDENEETVTALLSTNVSLHGLRTGSTTREAWRAVLGEPDYTIEMTGVEAESHLLCDGEGDYYELDGVRLTLHADQQGVLYAVVLTE